MIGWLTLVIFSWGIRGGIGMNAIPQAVTDSTSEVAIYPYISLDVTDLVPGFRLSSSWRGLFNDSTRLSRSKSRIQTAFIAYRKANSPFSFTIGRQFDYLGIGGLIDGAKARLNLKEWSFEVIGGKRTPDLYSKKDKFFDKEKASILGFQVGIPSFYRFNLLVGYGRETKRDTVLYSPIWTQISWFGKVKAVGDVYYDLENSRLRRLSIVEYGRIHWITWSFGYRYVDAYYTSRLLGFESEENEELSSSRHRIEGSFRIKNFPLGIAFGGWTSVFEEKAHTNLWLSLKKSPLRLHFWIGHEEEGWQKGVEGWLNRVVMEKTTVTVVGRLIEDPRWPNSWLESVRFAVRYQMPFGVNLKGELRLWTNPEVDREIQGYMGFYFPLNWRTSK